MEGFKLVKEVIATKFKVVFVKKPNFEEEQEKFNFIGLIKFGEPIMDYF